MRFLGRREKAREASPEMDLAVFASLVEGTPDLLRKLQAALFELWPVGEPGPRYKGPRPRSPTELFALLRLDSVEKKEDESVWLYYAFAPDSHTDGLFTVIVKSDHVEPYAFDT